jgi:hypothetical protein
MVDLPAIDPVPKDIDSSDIDFGDIDSGGIGYEGDAHIDLALQILSAPQDIGGADFALETIQMYLWESSPSRKKAALSAVLPLITAVDPATHAQVTAIALAAPMDVVMAVLIGLPPKQRAALLAIPQLQTNLHLAGYAPRTSPSMSKG